MAISYFKIPGTDDLHITDVRCIICDKRGHALDYELANDCYYITMYGVPGFYNKLWLHHIAKLGLDIPDAYKIVSFVPILNGYRKEFQYVVVFNQPVYYDKDKKYRIVPDYPTVAISKNGEGVRVKDGSVIKISYPKNPMTHYPTIAVWDNPAQSYSTKLVHRLVASAWCHNPNPGVYTVVNHKDGNKSNYSMYNLEWTDAKGNNLHAVNNNLRSDNVRSCIRDIKTHEIKEFSSLMQVAEFLKIPRRETRRMRAYLPNRVYLGKYELRVAGDTRPWLYDETTMNVKASRYTITVTEDDGVVKKFNGVTYFITYYKLWNLGGNVNILAKALKEQHPKYKIEIQDHYGDKIFQARNISTGEVVEFDDRRKAAETIDSNIDQIHSALLTDGRQNLNGYQLRYPSNKSWPTPLEVQYTPVCIKVTNIETGDTQTYASLREAARTLCYDRKRLKRMLRCRLPEDIYTVTKG